MKLKHIVRIGALVALAIGMLGAWSLVADAHGRVGSVTVDRKGSFDRSGVATLEGRAFCPGAGTVTLSGSLRQPVGRKGVVTGAFFATVNCGPDTHAQWSIEVVPVNGRFAGGNAYLTGAYYGYYSIIIPGSTPYPGGYPGLLAYPDPGGYPAPTPPSPECQFESWDGSGYRYGCYFSGHWNGMEVKLDGHR